MKTINLIYCLLALLVTSCIGLKKNQIDVVPVFYATNDYGKNSYFIGVRFGSTNDFPEIDIEKLQFETGGGKGSKGCGGKCSD